MTSLPETVHYQDTPRAHFTPMDGMRVEPGTKADWDRLHHLHYKAESLPIGPHFWRCVTAEGELVGVVVTAVVSLLLKPRHVVFPRLKPHNDSKFTNQVRARWLNANMRRDARIVTDTLYRGVGISYRMTNLANRLEGKRYIEIQSSMSKYNPFDVKAGFRHAHLNTANAYERGVKFLRGLFDAHPADHQAIMEEYARLKPEVQTRIRDKMLYFYYKNSAKEQCGSNLGAGIGRIGDMSFSTIVRELQQLVFATPVYGIWENPDFGRTLPESLPVKAYDLQSPHEPLRLDLLESIG